MQRIIELMNKVLPLLPPGTEVRQEVEQFIQTNEGGIAMIWLPYDVMQIRPDLNRDEAIEVLAAADHHADCSLGITWDTLQAIADEMYPTRYSTAQEEQIRNAAIDIYAAGDGANTVPGRDAAEAWVADSTIEGLLNWDKEGIQKRVDFDLDNPSLPWPKNDPDYPNGD